MHILNIGTPISNSDPEKDKLTKIKFDSGVTLLDADVIFWDISVSFSDFVRDVNKNDKIINRLQEVILKRKQELDEFFKIGRTLFITSPIFESREFTFGDSNTKVNVDFIDCFDIIKPQYEKITGQNIEPIEMECVKMFYNRNSSRLCYDLKLINSKGTPLMYIKETDYVVSEFYRIKNGLLIILPQIRFNRPIENNCIQFLASINQFIEGLKKYNIELPHQIPEWVDDYIVSGEKSEKQKITKLRDELSELKEEIEKSENNLANFRFLKALFSSDGDTLENVVSYVFQDMGFTVEPPKGNRDDLILKWEDKVAVVEIKGLSKSAAEKNAAQLQKWVSNYHVDNNFNPKGILVANTFKKIPVEQRQGEDFPHQMLSFAEQMKHNLITGIQLLCIYLDFKNEAIKIEKVVDLLFNNVGKLNYRENPMEVIEKL